MKLHHETLHKYRVSSNIKNQSIIILGLFQNFKSYLTSFKYLIFSNQQPQLHLSRSRLIFRTLKSYPCNRHPSDNHIAYC